MKPGPVMIIIATSLWASVTCQASHGCFMANLWHLHHSPMMWVLSCLFYKWVGAQRSEDTCLGSLSQYSKSWHWNTGLPDIVRIRVFSFPDPATVGVTKKIRFWAKAGEVSTSLWVPLWAASAEIPQGLECLLVLSVRLAECLVKHPSIFCHFKKSRQFLHLTKVKSFKALEDWKRE